jgi:serine/threonine protein phosphatase PrpC
MILIASDGVWEYMDNQEAVDVLAGQPDASAGAAALVSAAVDRWQAVDPSYIDDITVVVARLHRGQ